MAEIEKINSALDALEVHQLGKLLARAREGGELSAGDLKLMRELRDKHSPKQPHVDETTSDLRGARSCDEWKTLAEAAALICVQERSLRGYVNGEDDRPVLAHRMVHGRKCVQPSAAYRHLLAHGRGKFATLKAPPGFDDLQPTAQADSKFDREIVAALDGIDPSTVDPHELSWKLLCAGVSREKIQSAVAVANSIQRKHDAAVRAGKNIPPDDVVRMLRAHVELFVDEVDEGSARFAADILRLLREKFGYDLSAKNKDAVEIIDQFHRENFGNGVIGAMRKRTDDQIKDVQVMEFVS